MINEKMTIKDLVNSIPETKIVFDTFGIKCDPQNQAVDFSNTIYEVANKYGIDKNILIENLNNMESFHSKINYKE